MPNRPKATKKARRSRSQITLLASVGEPDVEVAAEGVARLFLDRITSEREKAIDKKRRRLTDVNKT